MRQLSSLPPTELPPSCNPSLAGPEWGWGSTHNPFQSFESLTLKEGVRLLAGPKKKNTRHLTIISCFLYNQEDKPGDGTEERQVGKITRQKATWKAPLRILGLPCREPWAEGLTIKVTVSHLETEV